MKRFNFILSIIILLVSAVLCQQIISNSIINQKNRDDYAEVNNVKYGILNLGKWKQHVAGILITEINTLDLTEKNEQDLKNKIRDLLNTLIDKVEIRIRDDYSGSAWGKAKLSIMEIFVSMDAIKKGIPEYADAIYHEMITAKTKDQIKLILNNEVLKFSKKTYDIQDGSQLKNILSDTNSSDIETARIRVNNRIEYTNNLIFRESLTMIILSVILFCMSGFRMKPLTPSRYIILIISLIPLLIAGVTMPMMNIEAKISRITFMVMGHPIHFVDQILYFQSKSIIDVFRIMINDKDFMMKFVGFLMMTFSVVFPILKMISSMIYYYNFFKASDNPFIKFFVFKSGKWSMADVMAVAISMSYIGFNGMIKNQLSYMNLVAQKQDILTFNGSSLQPGFYLFLSYTLLALFLAVFLARKPKTSEN
ncbi:MAG: paraquat-inducible protein A [Spirochaetota bacterium]